MKMENKIGSSLIGRPVIVRANVAGVHAGILKEIAGTTIIIENAYRLWRYYTRDTSGSLSDVAANGLTEGADHKIGARLKSVLIENPNGLEVAEMTDESYASLIEYVNKTHKI